LARTGADRGSALPPDSGPGERLRRLHRRRRLVREELLAVAFLLIALGVTVAVLASQWLGSSSAAVRPHLPTVIAQTYGSPGGTA
jgi:hypothetical protein